MVTKLLDEDAFAGCLDAHYAKRLPSLYMYVHVYTSVGDVAKGYSVRLFSVSSKFNRVD